MVTEEVIHSLGEYKLLDVAKLLVLVEVMPELNDITRKVHPNQDEIAKAWQLIILAPQHFF